MRRPLLAMPNWLHKRITETASLYNVSVSSIIVAILEAFWTNADHNTIERVIHIIRTKQIESE
jgi:hypothetical protein